MVVAVVDGGIEKRGAPGVGTMAKTSTVLKEMVVCIKSHADVGGTEGENVNCGHVGRAEEGGLGWWKEVEWDQQGDNWTLKLFSCLAAFTDVEDDTKV